VVSAENVTVTNGAVGAVASFARALRHRGIDRIAVEDPGWIPLRAPFDGSGVSAIPVHVDDEGLIVSELAASGARAALVSPAHAFPLGSVMSLERRAQLLDWPIRSTG
jgi:GntR family transcriptional regulator/MocR family aminotransferase